MSKFTKGSWHIQGEDNIWGTSSEREETYICKVATGHDEARANAALIAAAPEMYEAIESILSEIDGFGENLHKRLASYDTLLAILAKARGEK